jgi:hypothetical protein
LVMMWCCSPNVDKFNQQVWTAHTHHQYDYSGPPSILSNSKCWNQHGKCVKMFQLTMTRESCSFLSPLWEPNDDVPSQRSLHPI